MCEPPSARSTAFDLTQTNQGSTMLSKTTHPDDERLFESLHSDLKLIARTHMANEKVGHTLQPTALVNEAYLRMIRREDKIEWESREHFLRVAAAVMRRILIDHARTKTRQKRGGGMTPVELSGMEASDVSLGDELLAVHEALLKLERGNPKKAEFVSLRFFAGLTIDEAAKVLSISRTTAKQWWQFSKAWLHHELTSS